MRSPDSLCQSCTAGTGFLSQTISLPDSFREVLEIFHIVFVIIAHRVPHLKEGHRQTVHRVPLQADACVLPESEGLASVEIFVCQIIASRKTNLPVDHGDLAVIAVIQKQVQTREKRIEYPAFNTLCLCSFHKIHVDKAQASHIVVKNAHFDARAHPVL